MLLVHSVPEHPALRLYMKSLHVCMDALFKLSAFVYELPQVLIRGRLYTVRGKGKSAFLMIRQRTATVQV